MTPRVVLDTNVVVSALLFDRGRVAWLRESWRAGRFQPLVSEATTQELIRVLAYPKFALNRQDIEALLADFLPYAATIAVRRTAPDTPRCSDADDQMFVDLAVAGRADALVTGDATLLALDGACAFAIETPAAFRERLGGGPG